MLSPEHVLPFLLHKDVYVREHAASYLADGYESTPQLVPVMADHFWESIDRYGVKKSRGLFTWLKNVPQTDASLSRALAMLSASPDEETDFHLQHAVGGTGLELVRARREELLAAPQLLPRVREHLAARLALADVPVDDLWDQLLQYSDESKGRYYGEYDTRVAGRLVEALAHHGDAAAALAMKRLTSGLEWEWVELYAIQLLGKLRYAPAIDLLLERLQVEDDDVTPAACGQALIQIGTDEIVGRLEAVCKGNRWDVRMDVAGFLGNLKRPASEQALIRLLEAEEQEKEREEREGEEAEDVCGTIGAGLCDLCTTDGLEVLRQLILHERYDPGIAEVDDVFLTVCKMTGFEPPEAPAWLKVVAKRRAGRERLLSASPMIKAMRERWRQGMPDWVSPVSPDRAQDGTGDDVGGWDSDPDAGFGAGIGDSNYLPPEPITPIRRDTPKVGRNDPCPCGSGKKYKKCCQDKTAV